MAAITPFLERPDLRDRVTAPSGAVRLSQLAGLDGGMKKRDPRDMMAATHAELTRFSWVRYLLEKELAEKKFWVEVGGPEAGKNEGQLVFRISPGFSKDVVPWSLFPGKDEYARSVFAFWGEASKMGCPTWDLPAGSPYTGGTCVGATAGQTVVPLEKRKGQLDPATGHTTLRARAPGGYRVPYNEGFAICQFCYASSGNYAYGNTQGGELVRYWWTRWMLSQGAAGRREWVELVTRALLSTKAPVERHGGQSIIPVRIHSAGDFYAPDYAEAWMEVANKVAEAERARAAAGKPLPGTYRFWAPTRTWAAPGWTERWPGILARLNQANTVVRASGYNTNDPAPDALTAPGKPGYSKGTTAIWAADNKGKAEDRANMNCPVYALKSGVSKTCASAGCRVCWIRPELSVNYTVH